MPLVLCSESRRWRCAYLLLYKSVYAFILKKLQSFVRKSTAFFLSLPRYHFEFWRDFDRGSSTPLVFLTISKQKFWVEEDYFIPAPLLRSLWYPDYFRLLSYLNRRLPGVVMTGLCSTSTSVSESLCHLLMVTIIFLVAPQSWQPYINFFSISGSVKFG